MFHFTKKRIEVHVCICLVAYIVYKKLERILKSNGISMGLDKVISKAKAITTLRFKLQESNETISTTMLLTDKHKSIEILFETDFDTKICFRCHIDKVGRILQIVSTTLKTLLP